MVVILDMHNYKRYGKPEKIIGKDFSADAYARAWVQIASQPGIKNNPNVLLDLMNEPKEMSTQLVLDNYNTVIKALRAAGINNQVQLEGNGWSGAHSWTQNWYDSDIPKKSNAEVFIPSNIHDNKNNYVINVHQYFDDGYAGTKEECIATMPNISGLNEYLQRYSLKAIVTEMGGASTQQCAKNIDKFLKELSTEHYLGWTAWVGGEKSSSGPIAINYVGILPGNRITLNMTEGFGLSLDKPKISKTK
jgi:endoglucanase